MLPATLSPSTLAQIKARVCIEVLRAARTANREDHPLTEFALASVNGVDSVTPSPQHVRVVLIQQAVEVGNAHMVWTAGGHVDWSASRERIFSLSPTTPGVRLMQYIIGAMDLPENEPGASRARAWMNDREGPPPDFTWLPTVQHDFEQALAWLGAAMPVALAAAMVEGPEA